MNSTINYRSTIAGTFILCTTELEMSNMQSTIDRYMYFHKPQKAMVVSLFQKTHTISDAH